jgi:3-hydroxyisobutyrate dehydrogenase-like beta-hydroxyacid dehydrogenase
MSPERVLSAMFLGVGENGGMPVGLLHPGEMGAAIGAALRDHGETVLWASSGRSPATAERSERAGLADVGEVRELCRRCGLLVSVCPPHAALDVARLAAGFDGIYVDANAVSPQTARAIAGLLDRFVDGGIIGPPPQRPDTTRLYLSGGEAEVVAERFRGTRIDVRVVSEKPGAASALKMSYASWTKGSSALLLAARALAQAEGVEDALLDEWRVSLSHLLEQSAAAADAAVRKGWRWVGEMEEIAASYAEAGLPTGFHDAAAEIYERASADSPARATMERVLAAIRKPGSH